MRWSTVMATTIAVLLAFTACTATRSNLLQATFRLTNQATGKPLVGALVSVYDGFDKSLPPFAGPVRSENQPYHFADATTSKDGTLDLDLGQLEEDALLITAGPLYKYIRHRGNQVTVIHYDREADSLRVTAHHIFDLRTKLVTVIHFPEQRTEQGRNFSVIDVPMDR